MDETRWVAAKTALTDHYNTLWQEYDAVLPAEIFHYTSGPAAHSILRDRVFFASDVNSLSDASEVRHGRDLTCALLKERKSPLATSLLAGFEQGQGLAGLGDTWVGSVVCFCEDRDVLSQWRGYGERGFALGVDIRKLKVRAEALEFALLRMLYDRDRQDISCNR